MGSDDETSGDPPRRRTDTERQAIVAESLEGGRSVSEIAERHGVSAASIYLWRRQARDAAVGTTPKAQGRSRPPSPVTLVPVRIAPAPEAAASSYPTRAERIEITLANGRMLRVCDGIDPVKLARLVAALERDAA
jgi:transposase